VNEIRDFRIFLIPPAGARSLVASESSLLVNHIYLINKENILTF
jgi:hypothetical protein